MTSSIQQSIMPWKHPFPEKQFNLLGIPIARLTRGELLECFHQVLEHPLPPPEGGAEMDPVHFAYLNIAVSNQAADDPHVADLLKKADLIYVDGAGIRLGCRLLGASCPPRNTGADFVMEVLELCDQMGKSVGFLGGSPQGIAAFRQKVNDRFPALRITFCCDGYGRMACAPSIIPDSPDLLLVGLGVPLQEEWIDQHRTQLGEYGRGHPARTTLYWSVGALFEYNGGNFTRCPKWMGQWGMEWLYRLWSEPRRLWKRYLIGNPRFLLRCLCSRWQGRGGTP
jgi:N-acetylglucosaminyldiphosphoundecaprenol N-acetyl-beta-D-mannosaminyltransferase